MVVLCFVICPESGIHYRVLQEIAYDFVAFCRKVLLRAWLLDTEGCCN